MRIPVSFIFPPPKKIAVRIQTGFRLSVPVRMELLAARPTPRQPSRMAVQPRRLQIEPEPR
jgi:hypothetical protein